jgi:hypothetical protein
MDDKKALDHVDDCEFCFDFIIKFNKLNDNIIHCGICDAANFCAGCPNISCEFSYTRFYPYIKEAWYLRKQALLNNFCIEVDEDMKIFMKIESKRMLDKLKAFCTERKISLKDGINGEIGLDYVEKKERRRK